MRILYLDDSIKFVMLDGVRLGIVFPVEPTNGSRYIFRAFPECPERVKPATVGDYPTVAAALARIRELADDYMDGVLDREEADDGITVNAAALQVDQDRLAKLQAVVDAAFVMADEPEDHDLSDVADLLADHITPTENDE